MTATIRDRDPFRAHSGLGRTPGAGAGDDLPPTAPIAIIGMACRLPGAEAGVSSSEVVAFWKAINKEFGVRQCTQSPATDGGIRSGTLASRTSFTLI